MGSDDEDGIHESPSKLEEESSSKTRANDNKSDAAGDADGIGEIESTE